MSILITGVGGLLGSRLATHLLDKGLSVVGIDDFSGGYRENVDARVKLYEQEISSADLSTIFKKNNVDVVYHFAAYAAEGLSPFIRKYNYTNNLLATANIINACINFSVKRLIYSSSMATYGVQDPPFAEDLRPQPIDPYGIAKYACEMDIQVAGEQHGLDWCIIRPHNVYGRNQNIWDKYRNVLGIWMYQHLNNAPLTIFGDGTQKRAFSCIDDCLEPLYRASSSARASRQIINLGGIYETSIKEACATLLEVMGGGEVEHLQKRHEVHLAWSTYQKSVEILGFEHNTSLKDGLTDMWEWAKSQRMKKRFVWDQYEVEKGIYDFWKGGK